MRSCRSRTQASAEERGTYQPRAAAAPVLHAVVRDRLEDFLRGADGAGMLRFEMFPPVR